MTYRVTAIQTSKDGKHYQAVWLGKGRFRCGYCKRGRIRGIIGRVCKVCRSKICMVDKRKLNTDHKTAGAYLILRYYGRCKTP